MLKTKAKDQGHNAQVISQKKGLYEFIARSLARSPRQRKKKGHDLRPLSTNQKIVLSSTAKGHFRELVGLEAKANDFTFEAKAKDVKMCSRERRQGLYLWIIALLFKIKLIFFCLSHRKILYYFCRSHFAVEWDVFKQNYIDHRWYNHFEVFLPYFGNDTLFC